MSMSTDTATSAPATTRRWSGIIALEGIPTSDHRLVLEGALTFDLAEPLTLVRYLADDELYARPEVLGTIDRIERNGRQLVAHGALDDAARINVGDPVAIEVDGADSILDGDTLILRAGHIRRVAALAPADLPAWRECVVGTIATIAGANA